MPDPGKLSTIRLTTLITLAGVIGGVVPTAAAQLGVRLVGPPEDVAALRVSVQRDSAFIAMQERRLQRVEQTQELHAYLLCVQIRRTDPAAVPPACNAVYP